jgi:hypothetical protein
MQKRRRKPFKIRKEERTGFYLIICPVEPKNLGEKIKGIEL